MLVQLDMVLLDQLSVLKYTLRTTMFLTDTVDSA